ncbi:MAG: glycosyltransferase [Sarcina sp.]
MKKVCMFVWNHFTNDARVLRECTALTENNYEVTLIAIANPNDKSLKAKENTNNFNVIRVERYPVYLLTLNKYYKFLKLNLFLKIFLSILISFLFISFPGITLLFVILILLMLHPSIKSLLVKLNIITRMVKVGLNTNADIYHSNDLNTLPQGYICSKFLKNKILIYDSHEVQTSRTGYGKTAYFLENFFVRKVDRMIMTTHTRAAYVQNLYKIKYPKVIHNYPFYTGDESINNKYDLHKLANVDYKEPILLYQGGIQEGRGLENIIKAIRYFHKGTVVFIGDGKLKERLMKLSCDYDVENKVRFLAKVPVNELKYYTADAYLGFQVLNNVCFNHYSALSNKLFEYIMSDIPVVACEFPEIKKIVDGEKVGITIDSHIPEDIAYGVNILLSDKVYYHQCKNNCRKLKKILNWENEKKNFVDIYDKVLL